MLKRTLTACVAIPIAFFLIRAGGILFTLGVLILSLVGWYEFRQMMLTKNYKVYYLTSCLAVLALVISAHLGVATAWAAPVMTFSILGIMLEALYYHRRGNWAPEVALSSCAVLYIGLLFSHFVLLRHLDGMVPNTGLNLSLGEGLLWVALIGTWSSDTFAYIFGCTLGKHHLMPSVSPKKSIEGAVAGFIGCFIVVAALGNLWLGFPLLKMLIWGLVIGIFAPLGDLVESLMKRSFAIKDSGNFFPGHGGVLDRFDSLLFVIPISYYYIKCFLL